MTPHATAPMKFIKANGHIIVFCLALIWFGSFVAISFHHHGDDGQHADCPICIAGSLFSPGHLGNSFSMGFYPIIAGTPYGEATIHHVATETPALTIRPPPVPSAV